MSGTCVILDTVYTARPVLRMLQEFEHATQYKQRLRIKGQRAACMSGFCVNSAGVNCCLPAMACQCRFELTRFPIIKAVIGSIFGARISALSSAGALAGPIQQSEGEGLIHMQNAGAPHECNHTCTVRTQ